MGQLVDERTVQAPESARIPVEAMLGLAIMVFAGLMLALALLVGR